MSLQAEGGSHTPPPYTLEGLGRDLEQGLTLTYDDGRIEGMERRSPDMALLINKLTRDEELSGARWKEIRRLATMPTVAHILEDLRELRTGEIRPEARVGKLLRWDGWRLR